MADLDTTPPPVADPTAAQVDELLRINDPEEFVRRALQLGFNPRGMSVTDPDIQNRLEELGQHYEKLVEQRDVETQAQSQFTDAVEQVEEETGRPATPSEQAQIAEATGADFELQLPEWVLAAAGNRNLTPQEIDRFLENINQFHGTEFTDINDPTLQRMFATATAENAHILQATLDETPVLPTVSVTLPLGGRLTMASDLFLAASERYSVDEGTLARVVQMADIAGMTGQYGRNGLGGEPVVFWQPLLGVLKATGQLDAIAARAGAADDAKAKAEDYPFAQYNQGLQDRIAQGNAQVISDTLEGRPTQTRFDAGGVPKDEPYGAPTQRPTGIARIAADFKHGMSRFEDPGIALIYTLDPELAVRIWRRGQDGQPLSGTDEMRVQELAGLAGYSNTAAWRDALVTSGDPRFASLTDDWLSGYFQRVDAQRAFEERDLTDDGTTPQRPDPVQIEQAVKDMWRNLFLEDPDPAVAAQFTAQLNAAIGGLGEGESIDPNARLRQFAEGSDQYQEYYGRKPAGMAEEEYQGMFRSGQRSVLGNELAGNAAVKAGMREGQYQTTVGAAAGTREAWDNSTFLGRLARAAQLVNENT
jgi:hypothetical protein